MKTQIKSLKTSLLFLLLFSAGGCSTYSNNKQESPQDLHFLLYYENELPPTARKQPSDPRESKDFCGV